MGAFDSQEAFEQEYSAYTGTPLAAIVSARLSNDSYGLPKISTAYTWWKKSRERLLAEMAIPVLNVDQRALAQAVRA